MAEYCVDCWNKINNEKVSRHKYLTTIEVNLCEGCGEYKRTVIKKANIFDRLMRPIDWIIYLFFAGTERLYEFYCGKRDDEDR